MCMCPESIYLSLNSKVELPSDKDIDLFLDILMALQAQAGQVLDGQKKQSKKKALCLFTLNNTNGYRSSKQ